MEYRRRNRDRRKRTAPSAGGGLRALILLAVFAASAYLLIGTGVGKKLKEGYALSLLESCRGTDSPAPTQGNSPEMFEAAPTPSPEAKGETAEVKLNGIDVYLLQFGFYKSEEECAEEARRLRMMGAAGYAYNDNGDVRLIAAGFGDEASAESVKAALLGEGYECIVHHVSRSGAALLISAESERLEALRSAFSYAYEVIGKLDALAIGFDSNSMSLENALEELGAIRGEITQADSGVKDLAGTNGTVALLHGYFEDALDLIAEAAANSDPRAEFSSALKRIRVRISLKYCGFLEAIDGPAEL